MAESSYAPDDFEDSKFSIVSEKMFIVSFAFFCRDIVSDKSHS